MEKETEFNKTAPVMGTAKQHRQRRKKKNSAKAQQNTERDNNALDMLQQHAKSNPIIPTISPHH